jgi:hypothetical protein
MFKYANIPFQAVAKPLFEHPSLTISFYPQSPWEAYMFPKLKLVAQAFFVVIVLAWGICFAVAMISGGGKINTGKMISDVAREWRQKQIEQIKPQSGSESSRQGRVINESTLSCGGRWDANGFYWENLCDWVIGAKIGRDTYKEKPVPK